MKEEKTNKRKSLMLLIIGVLTLLIVVAGATYAFFIAQTSDGQSFNVNAETGSTDNLTFSKGEDINITANIENFAKEGGVSQDGTTTATATLIANNTTNTTGEYKYNIYLRVLNNNLDYSSYKKNNDETTKTFLTKAEKKSFEGDLSEYTPIPELYLTIISPEGTEYTEAIDGLTHINEKLFYKKTEPREETPSLGGYDITTLKRGLYPLVTDKVIQVTEDDKEKKINQKVDNWEIRVTFRWFEELDQELNAGKNFSAQIIIQQEEMKASVEDTLYANAEEDTLIYHDGSIKDAEGNVIDANDKSYRYSGPSDKVNNYVCLDNSIVTTVAGEPQECSNDDLYRIIGLFKDNDKYEMKLIKADYTTKEMLGGAEEGQTSAYNEIYSWSTSNYTDKGSMQTSDIAGYYWTSSDNQKNLWKDSALNKYNLNTKFKKYIEEKLGVTDDNSPIADHEWITAGNTWSNIANNQTVSTAYKNEITTPNGGSQAGYTKEKDEKTEPTKIGLMYVSDYGYATSQENWTTKLYDSSQQDYRLEKVKTNNWMYMGLSEWTTTRYADNSSSAFYVNDTGRVYNYSVYSDDYAVRPSFYLKSSTEIASGKGTKESPYRITW